MPRAGQHTQREGLFAALRSPLHLLGFTLPVAAIGVGLGALCLSLPTDGACPAYQQALIAGAIIISSSVGFVAVPWSILAFARWQADRRANRG